MAQPWEFQRPHHLLANPLAVIKETEHTARKLGRAASVSPERIHGVASPQRACTAGGVFWRSDWLSQPNQQQHRASIAHLPSLPKASSSEASQISLRDTSTQLPQLHSRVTIASGIASGAKGVVRFVGETQFKPGLWVGIELDEALGKNNGAVNGVRYFHCPAFHGLFVLPSALQLTERPSDRASDFASVPTLQQQDSPSPCRQTGMFLREPTLDESINLSENTPSHSLNGGVESDSPGEGSSGLQDVYGADWCDPHLFGSPSASSSTHQMIPREPVMLASSMREECGCVGEKSIVASAVSPAKEQIAVSGHADLEPPTGLDVLCERDLLFEAIESLRIAAEAAIFRAEKAEAQLAELREAKAAEESIERLFRTAEAAILRAETAEAQLDEGETQLGASSVRLAAMQQAIGIDLKRYIAEEVKVAVKAAVTEATTERSTVTAEAWQIREELAEAAELQRCCADGPTIELNCPGNEAHGDAGSLASEAPRMLAMKGTTKDARLGGIGNDIDDLSASANDASGASSDSVPTGDTTSSSARSMWESVEKSLSFFQVAGSSELSEKVVEIALAELEEAPSTSTTPTKTWLPAWLTPAAADLPEAAEPCAAAASYPEFSAPRAEAPVSASCGYGSLGHASVSASHGCGHPITPREASVMSETDIAREADISCDTDVTLEPRRVRDVVDHVRVRDVVDQFERIVPSHSRNRRDAPATLAPWPFAAVSRPRNFTVLTTPWSLAPPICSLARSAPTTSDTTQK